MAGDFGIGDVINVMGSLLKKAVQEAKMVICLPQAVTEMEAQVQRLKGVRDDINADLAEENRIAIRIVQIWLEKADEAIDSSVSINEEYQQHRNWLGRCPNCVCRYRISKRIRDWKLNVAQLHLEKQSDFPRGEYGVFVPYTQIPIQGPESGFFGNAIRIAQSELEMWLTEDSNTHVIGVYGMGGVGKTSLLQTINNSEKVCLSFELIIWLTVSKDCHILNLQNCIASRLNLQLPDQSNLEERKSKLFTHLKNKKFLLILDDIWSCLELQNLGVPLHLKDTGSKIVLSTRSTSVCTQMKADKITKVNPLSEEEGWQLFCSRAFRNENAPQEIEDVARKVAGECKGLPLAINIVSAAMTAHFTDLREWEVALNQMQNVDITFDHLYPEVDKELFQRLRWSYDVLPPDLKSCFLYFAAYPEDAEIKCESVIDIWVAEGMVKGNAETYLPDIAHSFIKRLRDRCLIEVVEMDNVIERISSVKIHDVLRDLAIRIAENECQYYFKAGQGRSDFPVDEVDGKGWKKMSLMWNRLHSLPTTFACSSLSALLLRGNLGINEVPESFLRELSSLKVLDLSHTSITSLPPCIGNLKHLASLQLESTDIRELPESICNLKELQFLNAHNCTHLYCLPESISKLKRLRVLDIDGCNRLRLLPRGISKLVSLEILRVYLPMVFEEDANWKRKDACFKDLQSLGSLRVLKVTMRSPIKEGVMGNWSKMRYLYLSFWTSLIDVNQYYLPRDMQAMKDLERFSLDSCNVERLPDWVTEFPKLKDLSLHGCRQLKRLPAEWPRLRALRIRGSAKLEEVELGMRCQKLKSLFLGELSSLTCVKVGAAASGSGGSGASPLPMFKSLTVCECPQLKRLRGGWDQLKCLESINVSDPDEGEIEWDDPSIKTSLQSKFNRY